MGLPKKICSGTRRDSGGIQKALAVYETNISAKIANKPDQNRTLVGIRDTLLPKLLRKQLNDELKMRTKTNLVKSRLFSEMLVGAVRKYHNRAIEAAQVRN